MKVKFIGATDNVTGSMHHLMTEKGTQILLDCGLYQGHGKDTDQLNSKLDVNPENIDAVILSHAHIDHSGKLPLLVKQGFRGRIYCTPATMDVCEILLLDSANIHENDIWYINKRRQRKGMSLLKPLYTVNDAEKALKLFKPIPFHTDFHISDELSFRFTGSGHIVGSAAVNITAKENGHTTRLMFSGDVGRYTDPLIKEPETFPSADYIICEATYGDRLHDTYEDAEKKLLDIVIHTCVEKRGKLIIPAFSLGRTQEVVYTLDKLKNKGLLPDIQIFVDSPLSTSATNIVRKHTECFNDDLKEYIETDPDPFGFNNLIYIREAEASKQLNFIKEPCIIISASGMADAGRIKHHIKNNAENPHNTILLTGYCAPNTLGARLLNGEKNVHIFGEYYDVRAKVESILSLSAHADYNELIRFLSCQDKSKLKKLFLVHGDKDAKAHFKTVLLEQGYTDVIIPEKGDVFKLD